MRCTAFLLTNLCRKHPAPDFALVQDALPVLARLLRSSDCEVLQDVCMALMGLSEDRTTKQFSAKHTAAMPLW